MVKIGMMIGERYEVLEKIGAGDIPRITVINKCESGVPPVLPSGEDTVRSPWKI